MTSWQSYLRVDPVPRLLGSGNPAIAHFARRDLLDQAVTSVESLWALPPARRILRKQRADGSWKYPGQQKVAYQNYALLETFRSLGILVEQFGFDRRHPAIEQAAGYLFDCQAAEGDFRGIYSQQYATTYSPAVMELPSRQVMPMTRALSAALSGFFPSGNPTAAGRFRSSQLE